MTVSRLAQDTKVKIKTVIFTIWAKVIDFVNYSHI